MTKQNQEDVRIHRDALMKAFGELNALLPKDEQVAAEEVTTDDVSKSGTPAPPKKVQTAISYQFSNADGPVSYEDEGFQSVAKGIMDKLGKGDVGSLTPAERVLLPAVMEYIAKSKKVEKSDDGDDDDAGGFEMKAKKAKKAMEDEDDAVKSLMDVAKADPQMKEQMDASEFLFKLAIAQDQTQNLMIKSLEEIMTSKVAEVSKGIGEQFQAFAAKQDKYNTGFAKVILEITKGLASVNKNTSSVMMAPVSAAQSQMVPGQVIGRPTGRYQYEAQEQDGQWGGISKAQWLDTAAKLIIDRVPGVTDNDLAKAENGYNPSPQVIQFVASKCQQ